MDGAQSLDPVTTRWAGALFNLARQRSVVDAVSRDLERIAAEMRSPAVQSFLFGGKAGPDEKKAKLAGLVGSFEPLTRNFVHLLVDRRREEVLRHLAEAWAARVRLEQGVALGVVESARNLGQAELDQLATALGARLGLEVRLGARLNPELVGGVRVVVGSHMIDHSVQGRLEGLRRKMLEARLPAART